MIHEILLIHISHYQNFSYRVRSRSRHRDKNIYTWPEPGLKTNIHFGELSGNLSRSGKTPGAGLPPILGVMSRVSAKIQAPEAQSVKWDHTFPTV